MAIGRQGSWSGSVYGGDGESADRAWLETVMPPVFGKEMEHGDHQMARISANITNTQIFEPFVIIRVIRRQR